MPRVYKLEETGYDPLVVPGMSEEELEKRLAQFITKALEWGDRIPIGVLLRNETTSTYEERIAKRIPFYFEGAPAKRQICDSDGKPTADLSPLFAELKVT